VNFPGCRAACGILSSGTVLQLFEKNIVALTEAEMRSLRSGPPGPLRSMYEISDATVRHVFCLILSKKIRSLHVPRGEFSSWLPRCNGRHRQTRSILSYWSSLFPVPSSCLQEIFLPDQYQDFWGCWYLLVGLIF
jgi:hypothetical protein